MGLTLSMMTKLELTTNETNLNQILSRIILFDVFCLLLALIFPIKRVIK